MDWTVPDRCARLEGPGVVRTWAARHDPTGRLAHGPFEVSGHAVAVETVAVPAIARVLLAVDNTESCARAATEAITRAGSAGADLLVLSVVEPRNLSLPGGRTRRVDQERDRLAAGAQAIVRRAHRAGVEATWLIWEGDPAEAILDASRSEGADVIVLGSRPRTNLRRLILGSVSSEVAHRADCDVVVVPG
jgi:nucleotide-binding universal stress UspA family protein